jgi:hypothetical protein
MAAKKRPSRKPTVQKRAAQKKIPKKGKAKTVKAEKRPPKKGAAGKSPRPQARQAEKVKPRTAAAGRKKSIVKKAAPEKAARTEERLVKKVSAAPLEKPVAPKAKAPSLPAGKTAPSKKPPAPSMTKLPFPLPERVKSPRYFFKSDIPDTYNETYLRALPRDPEWIYIYWEILPEKIEEARKKLGAEAYSSSKRVLRLLDITDIDYDGANAWSRFDTEINHYANNWYLRIPEPGRTYLIELGHLTADGRFCLLVRSNVFSVPSGEVSAEGDESWKNVGKDLTSLSSRALAGGLGSSERIAVPPSPEKLPPGAVPSPGVSSPGAWSPGAWSPGGGFKAH